MEFTFGMLFRGHIGYVPGKESCIDQNERYAQELGYDYMEECQKTAKILHFSSYKDYGKPWNPVSIMPGYVIWWEYAQGSPYYKEYFEEQWKLYDKVKQEKSELMKNISYRNLLLCAIVIVYLLLCAYAGIVQRRPVQIGVITVLFGLGIGGSILLRRVLMVLGRRKK